MPIIDVHLLFLLTVIYETSFNAVTKITITIFIIVLYFIWSGYLRALNHSRNHFQHRKLL